MSLLGGFGIAQDPVLFGKMLRRAPFMLYANPPKIGDEDLSDIENNDVSTTASGFFAYESLKVLQLLRSQDFPDMDKIVRAQPSILLADSSEISARLRFLSDIFLESMSLPSASTGVPTPRFDSSKTISGRNTVWYSSDADLSGEGNKFGGTLDPGMESECENIGMDINKDISYAVELNRMISPLDSIIHDERGVDVPIIAGIKCDRVITTTQHISSADSEIKVEPIVNNIDIQYTPLSDETETESKIADSKALAENVGALSHKDTAHDMLGALLFAYPAVLSIEHR